MKKPDTEYKRLRKLLIVSWMLILAILVGITLWASYHIRELKNTQPKPHTQTIKQEININELLNRIDVRDGIDGRDGADGVNGIDGTNGINGSNGQDGRNVTADMVAAAVVQYFEENPVEAVQGLQGDPGAPGLVILVRENPLTKSLECKFGNDTTWLDITECS